MALVHTGSRLANGDCGTNNRVFVVPPIAGAASVVAWRRRPESRVDASLQSLLDVPEHHGRTLQNPAARLSRQAAHLPIAAERNERQRLERLQLIDALQPRLFRRLCRTEPFSINLLDLRIAWPAEPRILSVAADEVGQQRIAMIRCGNHRGKQRPPTLVDLLTTGATRLHRRPSPSPGHRYSCRPSTANARSPMRWG